MPILLYNELCKWAVEDGDMYAWFFLKLLWNCMGRSASVDTLGLHNLRLSTDSLATTYYDREIETTGEHVNPQFVC
jgi:hypothetical protein